MHFLLQLCYEKYKAVKSPLIDLTIWQVSKTKNRDLNFPGLVCSGAIFTHNIYHISYRPDPDLIAVYVISIAQTLNI